MLLVFAVFACKAPPEAPARAGGGGGRAGGTAVVAISQDMTGINPLTATNEVTRELHDQLFLRLFEEQADYADHPPSFEPELADSIEWSPDGTHLTVRLRPDVVWSDGRRVTAGDVIWTLEARTHPDVAWSHRPSQDRIAAYEAIDDGTVVVRFRGVYPDRLADLNQSPILPRHVWGRVPFSEWRQSDDWFRRNLVSSGPFILTEWRPNEEVVLERNPLYFRSGRPRLDRVVFRVVPEKPNQLEQLLAGQIDFVGALPPATARRVAAAANTEVNSYWHRQYAFIVWNACRPPLDDPVVRRAFTLALDRRSMLEAIYGDYARLAVSPILSSLWAFNSEIEPWPYDPAEARRLLASRGWTDRDGDGVVERDGEALSLELTTNSENRMRIDAITMAQGYLEEVGVEVELELLEFNTWKARNEAHEFDAALGAWLIDTSLDPYSIFHSDSIANGGNWGCYRNAEVDRLIEHARGQPDAAGKIAPLREFQELVHRDQPYTFLFELQRLNGVSRRLEDVRPNSLRTFANLEDWWIGAAGKE